MQVGMTLPVMEPDLVDAMAPTTGFAGSEDDLADLLRRLAAIGTDEVHLIPTSSDVTQVARVAALLEREDLTCAS